MVSDAKAALQALIEVARERKDAQRTPDYTEWANTCAARKGTLHRKTHFDVKPIKPQRVYQEMNRAFGRDTTYVTTIGLSQIAGAQMLHAYGPRTWINAGQAGPLGWTGPAALGVVRAGELHHRNPITAYQDKELTGRVVTTWLRGEQVDFTTPRGRFLRREAAH